MSNIVPWNSPNGVELPVNACTVTELTPFINNLTPKEIHKVSNAFESELFDMATEYVWNRTINVLREKVLSFGKDFVLEMLGRNDNYFDSDDFISDVDVINLAADLGFINKTAKLKFTHCSEMIKHFTSRSTEEEMDKASAQDFIRSCVKYVLGVNDESYNFESSFASFRNKLTASQMKENDESLTQLASSPYFYKRTIVRTLLSLMKSKQGIEQENVFTNLAVVIPKIWDDLLPDDRRPIGSAYALAVNESNKKETIALKALLLKVKGFDYVPENTRSSTFIEAAQNLLRTHYSGNNFYNEPSAAKHLLSLGTAVPSPALGICITATLACKLGNSYGISWNAQDDLDKILDAVSFERWDYYLNQILPGDEVVVGKLFSGSERVDRWFSVVERYKLFDITSKNHLINKLLAASKIKNNKTVQAVARELYEAIRGK